MRIILLLPISASAHGHVDNHSTPLPPQASYYRESTGTYGLRICFNWGCSTQKTMHISQAEVDRIHSYFYCRPETPAEELQRIRLAVKTLEQLAAQRFPQLENDRGGNPDVELIQQVEGRMDCIDTASNTTNYLTFLERRGFLRWFQVGAPEWRPQWMLDQHYTATLQPKRVTNEGQTRQRWAVDAWFWGNGNLPFIQPLKSWKDHQPPWEHPLKQFNPDEIDYRACMR